MLLPHSALASRCCPGKGRGVWSWRSVGATGRRVDSTAVDPQAAIASMRLGAACGEAAGGGSVARERAPWGVASAATPRARAGTSEFLY